MTTPNRAALITKIHKVLKKHYKASVPRGEQPLLESLLFACCLENAHIETAEKVFQTVKSAFYDWNEVRVTTVKELSEVMTLLPDPLAAAAHLKGILQTVFESEYAFDLESLKKQNIGQAVKSLHKLDGATPFNVAYATQMALGGHSIPLDRGVLGVLVVLGAATEAEAASGTVSGLERAIPKSKGQDFGAVLHELGAEFVANPHAPRCANCCCRSHPTPRIAFRSAVSRSPNPRRSRPRKRPKKNPLPLPRRLPTTPPKRRTAARSRPPRRPWQESRPRRHPRRSPWQSRWPNANPASSETRLQLPVAGREPARRAEIPGRRDPAASAAAHGMLKGMCWASHPVGARCRTGSSIRAWESRRCLLSLQAVSTVSTIVLSIVLLTGSAVVRAAEPADVAAQNPAKPDSGVLDLDDPIEPLKELHPRSEAEADQVKARALFSAARMAEQKQDFAASLRLYERAARYDSNGLAILREIVPLAFSQDRNGEAVRYALLYVDKEATDPVLLRRLAITLSENNDNARALKLCEKVTELEAKEKPSAAQVALWLEIGRLAFITQKYPTAADYFLKVMKAFDKPEDYNLDDSQRRKLLGSGDMTYQLFGESFLEADRLDDAQAAYEKANVLLPNAAVLAYHLARIDRKRKQPDAGLEKLQVYFDKHLSSQGTAPYELLARLLDDRHEADQIVPRLEALHTADPENVPLTYFLAQQYVKQDEMAKAEPLYKKLLQGKVRPPVEAYQGLVEIYRRTHQAGPLLAILGELMGKVGTLAVLGDQASALEADEATTGGAALGGQGAGRQGRPAIRRQRRRGAAGTHPKEV